MEIPRHLDQHERAARLRLVTDSGTVTLHEPMDRSRNKAVLAAIRDLLEEAVDDPGLLREFRNGADFEWGRLYGHLRAAGVRRGVIGDVRTLADRFERPYPSLLRMRVDVHSQLDFAPGQYVTLRAHGTPRAYSLANSPSEPELEFCIRRVPGGRLTSDLFVHTEVGDEVVVRGPNGHMVLDDPSGRDLVFMATGTGVAPFKSMIDYTFERGWDTHEGDPRDIWLFLGCGWKDDLPHYEAFRAYDREYEHFHFVPSLTREELLTDWDGETDYIQRVLLSYLDDAAIEGVELPAELAAYRNAEPALDIDARIDPENTELYACGITAMVGTLVAAARAVGVPEDHMQYEGFG